MTALYTVDEVLQRIKDAQELLPIAPRYAEEFGVVYFVQSGQFVKIGHTRQWPERVTRLQTASPMELIVLHTEAGAPSKERALHRSFHHLHYRGEWFHAYAELFCFIENRKAFGVAA
jgi:hypothetical protein